jgi:large subunit ribosomal protein L14
MIQLRSILTPADNTGAKRLRVIHTKRKFAKIGDVVTCVVDRADPNGLVSDSQIVKAVLVRTKKEFRRADGSYIRFDDNAAVLINKDGSPLGSRVFGPIAREIKERGFSKIASLAKELV